ncbi:uncharacterized protein G2W53_039854 [Senna tora]|uniref:Uncharacterized protein n=1 Tax=Senna tora TaxID=362788 RepID=A0A834W3X4_9FABA|nr:uncharacterized protein G2W53_039854 [Senna tora]
MGRKTEESFREFAQRLKHTVIDVQPPMIE